MDWKVYIMDFPAPLGKDAEETLIGGIKQNVLESTSKEMKKWSQRFLTEKLDSFTGVFKSLEVMRLFGTKLQGLSVTMDQYIVLNKITDTRYELKIASKDLSAMQVDFMGKKHSVGKFMPHRWIRRYLNHILFPEMGFKKGEVKLTMEDRDA